MLPRLQTFLLIISTPFVKSSSLQVAAGFSCPSCVPSFARAQNTGRRNVFQAENPRTPASGYGNRYLSPECQTKGWNGTRGRHACCERGKTGLNGEQREIFARVEQISVSLMVLRRLWGNESRKGMKKIFFLRRRLNSLRFNFEMKYYSKQKKVQTDVLFTHDLLILQNEVI